MLHYFNTALLLTLHYIKVPLFDVELNDIAFLIAAVFTVTRFNVALC